MSDVEIATVNWGPSLTVLSLGDKVEKWQNSGQKGSLNDSCGSSTLDKTCY